MLAQLLPEKPMMVPMTLGIPRSQIIAFNVRLRLPSHAAKVGIHLATAPKDSQVAHRKEFWSGAPRTCTCNMVGIPDIARKERSFRDQRVFLRSFSTSANSSMVKIIFLGELSSLAVSGKVCCFSLGPNIVFEGMT